MLKAAVIILNWNTRKYLEKFLWYVVENTSKDGVKIFVVDNGSDDDSVNYLETNYIDKIELIKLEKNYGFAEGYNKVIEDIQAEYLVLLNSDVEPSPNWIEPLIRLMDSDTLIGACMPKILSYDQRIFFEYAGAAGGFIDKYGYPFCRGRLFNSLENDYGQYDKVEEVFWASGACIMLRAPLYKLAGGLDNFFFLHMEEIDLCWRLKNRGYKIMCQPESVIYHLGGGTLPQGNSKKVFLNHRNNLFLLYKNLPLENRIKILSIRFLLDIIASFTYLFNGSFNSFFSVIKAHISFFYNKKRYNKFRSNEKKFIIKTTHREMYHRSIVFDYFIRRKYTFKSLRWLLN